MKTILTIFTVLLLTGPFLFAGEDSTAHPPDAVRPGPSHGPRGQGMGRESNRSNTSLITLDQFLQLSNEQLKELEDTIRRIRQMSPAERQAYREKIAQYRQMSPEQRQDIQQAWGRLDTRVRNAWRDYMMSLSSEDRSAVHDKLQSISPEERTLWRIEVLKSHDKLPEDWSFVPSPQETAEPLENDPED